MNFAIDEQTLNDLNVFHRNKKNSIYGLFDYTKTRGGKDLLTNLFQHPLADITAIEERIALFRFFCEHPMEFPFAGDLVDNVAQYLLDFLNDINKNPKEHSIKVQLKLNLNSKRNQEGITISIKLLKAISNFVKEIQPKIQGTPFAPHVWHMNEILSQNSLSWIKEEKEKQSGKYEKAERYDNLLKHETQVLIQQLLTHVYWIDVCIAIATITKTKGFVFPRPLPQTENRIGMKGLYHPQLKDAIRNDVLITQKHQVIFLTGANMAGKSTFMKSFGLAIYLAHLGFPVAAQEMEFSIRDGLYTTINLPDQIEKGYSHFYAEVKRVKTVSQHLIKHPNLVIIFDELFRGTNVKDAYDGTLAVSEAYAKCKQVLFMVSTHIIEVGEVLKEKCDNIHFVYFPTLLQGDKTIYTYKLQEGVSADRLGMQIVNNERIVETIHGKEKIPAETSPLKKGQFLTDEQTLKDLKLLNVFKEGTIFDLYNKTATEGGMQHLRLLFMTPRSEAAEIKRRNELFQYFQKIKTTFPIKNYLLKNVSTYWEFTLTRYKIFSLTRIIWWGILKYFGINSKFNFVKQGILSTVKVMTILNDYLLTLSDKEGAYQKQYTAFQQLLNHKRLKWWQKEKENQTFSYFKLAKYDYLLRGKATNELQRLCQLLYELDACISVGNTATEKGFTWAEISEENTCYLHIQNLYHPELTNPVSNTIHMDSSQNMFFLTGANMAGKSTFMKSVGIAIYLAHAGFPIPAQKMKFAIMDGMYTSINISDNVNAGYSHFFAEVIRVKTVAQELNRGKKLMIIMDELFKGTNVKDAYDATFAITSAFASTRQSLFLISTHIIETANELQKQHNDILFQYFPARIEGDKSVYSYQLTKGITTDRYGMVIINHEKVIETIKKASLL